MKVFTDSDVVISSFISKTGAAYLLLNQAKLERYLSNFSLTELKRVVKSLNLDLNELEDLVRRSFNLVKIEQNLPEVKEKFNDYVLDPNDAHIIAGANLAKAKFLISYNLKHYRIDKIKAD